LEECLLNSVLRPFVVAQDAKRDGEASVAVDVDKLGEGVFTDANPDYSPTKRIG